MIWVPEHLLADTFALFRKCGGGRHECVAYWLGAVERPSIVDDVVHPKHTSVRGGYQIDDRWLTDFWFELARRRKSVRVQIHTHPHEAFHSITDDQWALIATPGFLSLVIPQYAHGPVGFEGAYLAERTDTGWRAVAPKVRLHISPIPIDR